MLNKSVLNADTSAPWDVGLGRLYCKALALILPKKAQAQGASSTRRATLPSAASSTPPPFPMVGRQTGRTDTQNPKTIASGGVEPSSSDLAQLEALRIRLEDTSTLMNSYGVEIHKKFALAVACFVFVLLGAPIALRFPRGGVGLTIGVSLFVFALYYVGLIGGESLANEALVPPFWAMWGTNVILMAVGVVLLVRMGKDSSSGRGGDWGDRIDALRGRFRRKRRLRGPERRRTT
jgi:lipopolysaccharide export system permease protein